MVEGSSAVFLSDLRVIGVAKLQSLLVVEHSSTGFCMISREVRYTPFATRHTHLTGWQGKAGKTYNLHFIWSNTLRCLGMTFCKRNVRSIHFSIGVTMLAALISGHVYDSQGFMQRDGTLYESFR